MKLIIPSPQKIVKDCYAPAPKIDLTLRTNGEEIVSVITSVGDVIRAGFDPPKVKPTITIGAGAAVWTANRYWNYLYVYVATQYNLVENAVTGNGSLAPRSNPSPSEQTDSTTDSTHTRALTVTTTSRPDIDQIWIYRTDLFDSADKATTAAAAGNAFWIGALPNNASLATVPFTDTNIVGQEQIENDNYPAPQAKYCVFDGTFFWTIGNDVFICEVTVSSTGLVTITNPADHVWFAGRNGQIAIFDGITTGGFDNRGSFYVKILSPSTLQLYQDIGLTLPIGISPTGTTQITIRGLSTTLFRSKVRNPFAWGYTDLIGDVQVPTPYNFSLGGGKTTSLAIIPSQNLLKIDTESPNKTFTFNLKNAGTPSFETSLRPISDSYSSSTNFAQFSATNSRGHSALWSLDTKSFTICECDGAQMMPVSDPIYKSLRDLSLVEIDRNLFHGCYLPRVELNCMFVRTEGSENLINRCFFYHWPTGYWGTMDVFDCLCSALVLDPFTNELKMIIGTASGLIGEFAAEGQYWNWTDAPIEGKLVKYETEAYPPPWHTFTVDNTIDFSQPGILGNWMLLYDTSTTEGAAKFNFRFARIANVVPLAGFVGWQIDVDQVLNERFEVVVIPWPLDGITTYYKIGIIEMIIGRMFNLGNPFETKKLEEVLSTWLYPKAPNTIEQPAYAAGIQYKWTFDNNYPRKEYPMDQKVMTVPIFPNPDLIYSDPPAWAQELPVQFGKTSNLKIDEAPIVAILITDRNYLHAQLMNYEMRFSTDGNNN